MIVLTLTELAYAPRHVGPLSLSLAAGQVVLLCGPSGSGKSTLCSLLAGELEPTGGGFALPTEADGKLRLATVSNDIVGQLLGATVGQELELGRLAGGGLTATSPILQPLLERWRGRDGEDPHGLSTGEKQLLLLTSLALGGFSTLILDEAMSCLDHGAFTEVCRALRVLAANGMLVLLVSHELRVLPWVDRCLGLADGRLAFERSREALTWEELRSSKMWPGTLVFPSDLSSPVLHQNPLPPPPAERGLEGAEAACVLSSTQHLTSYGEQSVWLDPGRALAVSGVSGAGKSRLLWALAGLARLEGWTVSGEDGYRVLLPQPASSVLWRRSVQAELQASAAEGERRAGAKGLPRPVNEIPESWLARSPRSLSQGQMKLLACLCLLLQRPSLLLLDEPFAGLDAELRGYLEERLREYLGLGGRLVFTTHQPDEMALYPGSLLVLEAARPAYLGPPGPYFESSPDPRLGLPLYRGWLNPG